MPNVYGAARGTHNTHTHTPVVMLLLVVFAVRVVGHVVAGGGR